MALVIFCVALVEAMRTRMSFSEAILSLPRRSDLRSDRKPLFRHARPCAGHPRLDFLPRAKHVELVSRIPSCCLFYASRVNPTCDDKPGHDGALSERLGVTLDHRLQLGGGIV